VIVRRIPALALSVTAIGGLVMAGRETATPTAAVFATPAATWMPSVPAPGGLTDTWYCPGVPASGDDGVGGEVIVANRDDRVLEARVTVFAEAEDQVTEELTVEGRTRAVVDLDELVTAPFVSAMVEIRGGGGVVEQRSVHPDGESVAACAGATSSTWYLADGSTVEGNVEEIVLTNPYESTAIVDVRLATADVTRQPTELQGFPVPARSVRTVDLSEVARDEEVLGVDVVASSGRIIVARAQHDVGGGRRGHSVALGSPALRDQWWFANGAKGVDVDERYSLYNPTDDDVEVVPVFLGIAPSAAAALTAQPPITVPANEVVTLATGELDALPDGPYSLVFGTQGPPSIVVERALTRTIDDRATTSILLGAPPRADGYVASTWHVGIGPQEPTTDALVVFNVDNTAATVEVRSVGPDGSEPVEGLEALSLPAAGRLSIDLTNRAAVGRELIVRSSSRIFVERALRREDGSQGRGASWAVPAE